MPIIKCKMCGGDIELSADRTLGTCESCGSAMTLPKIDDDQRAAAFNRGNHFRRIGEFDKALAVYERIVQEDDTDAEAHWCCALCRFGIEYVEDPATYEWIPTCHRASFDSFLEDVDYLAAVDYSDGITRRQYKKDAVKIAEIQKGIIATSQKEEPFDIFICYKESDDNGERTKDSLLAQEIYYQLTDAGYRVFFSRITLEDKVGSQYEPYIFAALNSAKIMVAMGTKAEHFNAAWVKNEWSRFLMLMKKDRTKLLLPCYRDMDPYALPEQIAVLQSYDMGKIGFVQDLLRGIKKVLDSSKRSEVKETVIVERSGSTSNNVTALLKRGNMALEDGDWAKADSFFEEVLNQDAENGEAYLGKFLAQQRHSSLDQTVKQRKSRAEIVEETCVLDVDREKEYELPGKYSIPNYLSAEEIYKLLNYNFGYPSTVKSWEIALQETTELLQGNKLYVRALKYADEEQKQKMTAFDEALFGGLKKALDVAKKEENDTIERLKCDYADYLAETEKKVIQLWEAAERRRAQDYAAAVDAMDKAKTLDDYEKVKRILIPLTDYKDAIKIKIRCGERIEELLEEIRAASMAEMKQRQDKQKVKKKKRLFGIIVGTVAVIATMIAMMIAMHTIVPAQKRNEAIKKLGEDFVVTIENLAVGDTCTFGRYEQDNDASNGKEEIKWIVLDRDDENVLLLSLNALDGKQYSTSLTKTTWGTCALREWLNNEFLNAAFTADEKTLIPEVTISTEKNSKYKKELGEKTQDQVFLLSVTEAREYFSTGSARKCMPMKYAVANGVSETNSGFCWWWLRSSDGSAYVSEYGYVKEDGYSVKKVGAVRPALWINLGY